MVINTKEISSRIKMGTMLITLLLAALIVVSLIFAWSPNHMLEIVVVVVFVLEQIFLFIKKYNYIYYCSDGFKILVRYSSLGTFSAGNYSIEIPKKDFVKADVEKSCLGLRRMLIVYVKTPQGIAKFRPVSISILSLAEEESLLSDLKKFNS